MSTPKTPVTRTCKRPGCGVVFTLRRPSSPVEYCSRTCAGAVNGAAKAGVPVGKGSKRRATTSGVKPHRSYSLFDL